MHIEVLPTLTALLKAVPPSNRGVHYDGTEGRKRLEITESRMIDALYFIIKNRGSILTELKAVKPEWRCFHCDCTFDTEEAAAAHFGATEISTPICQMKAEEVREMEAELERYRAEDTDKDRAYHAMCAKYETRLREEEEKGFQRGMVAARSDFHNIVMDHEQARRSMSKRIDELLEANTEYLNRARAAEAHAASKEADVIEGIAFNMTGMACDRVGGSYGFPGVVVAHFTTLAGNERVVVECVVPEVAGMLHIYSPKQIENTNADDFRRVSLLDLIADSERLQKDPGGGDRIDALESELELAKSELEIAKDAARAAAKMFADVVKKDDKVIIDDLGEI